MDRWQGDYLGRSNLEIYIYFSEWRHKLITRYLIIFASVITAIYFVVKENALDNRLAIAPLIFFAFVNIILGLTQITTLDSV